MYPDDLSVAVVVGLKRQLTIDGDIADRRSVLEIVQAGIFDIERKIEEGGGHFVDDLTGAELSATLVRQNKQSGTNGGIRAAQGVHQGADTRVPTNHGQQNI